MLRTDLNNLTGVLIPLHSLTWILLCINSKIENENIANLSVFVTEIYQQGLKQFLFELQGFEKSHETLLSIFTHRGL